MATIWLAPGCFFLCWVYTRVAYYRYSSHQQRFETHSFTVSIAAAPAAHFKRPYPKCPANKVTLFDRVSCVGALPIRI
jgi:hypothetical protein